MIYADNAATTDRKPFSVYASYWNECFHSANAGRAGHRRSMRLALFIERTRESIRSAFFDGEVVFTKNCTEALNLAFTAVPKGKIVLAAVMNHNSVLRPLKRAEKICRVRFVRSEEMIPILRREKTNVGMVVLCGISNVTGKRENVEEIAEAAKRYSDALVVVDGAQSAGKIQFGYENVDIFCASGHKSLYGMQGTGFILFRRGIPIMPIIVGGTGTSGFSVDIPSEIPEGLEAGTLNGGGIVALYYGIRYTMRHRTEITEKEKRLENILCQNIRSEKIKIIAHENGIVLCTVEGKTSGEVADVLSEKYRICVRGGYHCAPLMHKQLRTFDGAVRISFGRGNTVFEARKIASALNEIAEEEQSVEKFHTIVSKE